MSSLGAESARTFGKMLISHLVTCFSWLISFCSLPKWCAGWIRHLLFQETWQEPFQPGKFSSNWWNRLFGLLTLNFQPFQVSQHPDVVFVDWRNNSDGLRHLPGFHWQPVGTGRAHSLLELLSSCLGDMFVLHVLRMRSQERRFAAKLTTLTTHLQNLDLVLFTSARIHQPHPELAILETVLSTHLRRLPDPFHSDQLLRGQLGQAFALERRANGNQTNKHCWPLANLTSNPQLYIFQAWQFVGHLVFSYASAYVVSICFEIPFIRLERFIIKKWPQHFWLSKIKNSESNLGWPQNGFCKKSLKVSLFLIHQSLGLKL